MNTKSIINFIKSDKLSKKDFIGVYARDQLPEKVNWPSSLIVNTDIISKSGEHWLGLYFNENGQCDFFDPLGMSPKYHKFDKFIEENSIQYFYNSQRVQALLSTNCGYFCC
jgi:hypothetical protein